MKYPTQLYIGGEVRFVFDMILPQTDYHQYTDSAAETRITLHNPFDDSTLVEHVHVAGEEDVDKACNVATTALRKGPWSCFTGPQRSACLLRVADLIEKNAEKLAYLESKPTGRPISGIIHFDIKHMVDVFRCMSLWLAVLCAAAD